MVPTSSNPRDTMSPDQKGQSRSISASFSRPGSTIDDLMARLNSPNPNPVPPTVSSPFGPPGGLPGMGNGSAMTPPPPHGGQLGGYPSGLYSPAAGLGGMLSPASRGAPSPLHGGSSSMPGAGTPGLPGNENRQSQLLDLLRNAGQSPSGSSPAATPMHQAPPANMYQPYVIGHGQPPQLHQQHSFSHHHPAMQQNNSFSGAPSTGLNRVASPTYGLSAGAGNHQAQSLLAALINGSSTPVSSVPQPEIPFAIHQPVIVDEQVPSSVPNPAPAPAASGQTSAQDQVPEISRVDTFGNSSKEVSDSDQIETRPEQPPAVAQISATETKREPKPEISLATRNDISAAGSETTVSSDVSKKTFFSAFVSPFDAFDAPVPVSDSGSNVSAKKKNKKEKAVKDASQTPAAAESTSIAKTDVQAAQQVQKNAAPKTELTQSSSAAEAPSVPAPSSSASTSKKAAKQAEIPVVYRASAFVDPSRTTNAGTIPSADYTFDVSEPHLESLAHVDKPFEERRVSNIRTHVMTTGLSAGSILKAGVNLLAYALPKGKARIVNQDTAESTLVTLQSSDAAAPLNVIDLAVTDEWVVLLGHDGSFGIWRVDVGEEARALVSERAFFYAAKGGKLVPQRVELLASNGETSLIIMSEDAVFSGSIETLTRTKETDLSKMMEVKYEVSHPRLVDLDVSIERKQFAVVERSGNFALYNISNPEPIVQGVYRVPEGTWATSARIVNSNVLIGSSRGEFSLVSTQTSGSEASVEISKITFSDHGMTINPEKALWMKPRFNAKEGLLWIVSFSRASVFIIKYKEPKSGNNGSLRRRAFRKLLEIPLEALGDFTLDPCDSASFFYKDPKGFSQASVAKHLLELLEESAEEDVDESEDIQAEEEHKESAAVEPSGEAEQHLSSRDMGFEDSAKALDANVVAAIQQDAQQADLVEPLTVNQDVASNKPGSGLGDVDLARQETEIRTQLSTANTIDMPSDLSSANLSQLRSSIAQEVKQSLTTQLTAFSINQLDEIRAIRRDLMAQEVERQQTLVTLVTDVIDRDVKDMMQRIVSEQLEEKVVPLIADTLQRQTAHAFNSTIPAQINAALQDTVLSQVERSLIPHLGRTFTATLSPIVERNVRALIADTLVPKFMGGVDVISDELSGAIHREMLEVRKDVLVEQSAQLKASEAMIESMTSSMMLLISQVKDLSEQVKELKLSQARPPQAAPLPVAVPSMPPQMASAPPVLPTPQTLPTIPQQPTQVVPPRPVVAPGPPQVAGPNSTLSAQQPEEEFLNALMTMGDDELIRFVTSRVNRIPEYLPGPGQGTCPLSQQVLLTMIHRLSKAMAPLPTASHEYQVLLQWIVRTAYLIDGKATDIADFFGPVRSALAADYQALIAQYAHQQDRTPATVQAVRMMNQVLQVLGSK
ncbi:hypothetical protein NCC49_000322 [Naganishia albida]|nr:hypothetical protein NCC49_000322 [Naganishia albida]